ncbi:MAG: YdeI/OmpD-associated family protein [Acidobacteriota bacterium]|nr:YdeI/OmpD-associated family protein [Acidobacteriota bacterium]
MTDRVISLFQPTSRADWRRWLRANHAKATGVWLVYLKGVERQLTYAASVEEALCYGWIDSTMRPIDAASYRQLFTPRKPKSTWSALNKKRVEDLLSRALIAAPGLASIETAKANGSWTSLDAVEALSIPPDLARALASNKKAKAFFDGSAPSSRKGALHWINSVKSLELRAARVAHVVSQAARGLRPAHQEKALAKGKAAARARKAERAPR